MNAQRVCAVIFAAELAGMGYCVWLLARTYIAVKGRSG